MAGYNQYVGMRYVPIVDGEWSQSKAYEPLVVVVYNGNSYISKTYVPAGTLPTNDTYWILAANYNAQVEQYRTEVRHYQQTVEGFADDISDVQDRTQIVEDGLDALETTMDKWETVDEWSDSTAYGTLYVRKVGHVVSINFAGTSGVSYTGGTQTLISTLPERFRPAHAHYGLAVDNNMSIATNAFHNFSVLSNGAVRLFAYNTGNKQIEFGTTYIVAV